MAAAKKRPEFNFIFTTDLPKVPQLAVKVDRDKVLKQGVALNDVYQTLQAFMGGAFINFFNRFGRVWQVYVQAEGDFRTQADNVGRFFVRNSSGQSVPLSAVTSIEKAQQGVPPAVIFGFSVLFVFLILAAMYESWSLPFSVLLSTPVAVFGALGVLFARRVIGLLVFHDYANLGLENNVYAQIGLVMLIGLAAKNAILIVEFAKLEFEKGKPLVEAALEGAKLRLRPILMTSLAFILGCVPLWRSSGAGSVSRQVMGTAVIGGMTAASGIAIFIIPALFYIVEKIGGAKHVTAQIVITPHPQAGAAHSDD
jgi:HAE1 family hydrophobic/amphiphilic exporter-1